MDIQGLDLIALLLHLEVIALILHLEVKAQVARVILLPDLAQARDQHHHDHLVLRVQVPQPEKETS